MSEVPDRSAQPSAHILCVAYDESLLLTRKLLLEGGGYKVTPSLGFGKSVTRCRERGFDLLVLCHSIPETGQAEMMREFRDHSGGPVLSLQRRGEAAIPGADYYTFPDDPEELLRLVAEILNEPPQKKPSGMTKNIEKRKRA